MESCRAEIGIGMADLQEFRLTFNGLSHFSCWHRGEAAISASLRQHSSYLILKCKPDPYFRCSAP